MTEEELPDLSGKLILVYVLNSGRGTEDGLLLEYAEFQRQGGRLFLKGRLPNVYGLNWIAGCHGAIAWDSVTQYIIFNSTEDYAERLKASPIPPKARLFRWWSG